jgi:hypothetical protein
MLIIGAIVVSIFVFIIIFLVVAEKNTVYGTCPKCQTRIGLMKGIGACDNCGAGLQLVNGGFATPKPGFVPDFPAFRTNLSKLKHPSKWSVIWPGQCCVCGASAAREEKIKIKSVKGQVGSALAPTNLTHTDKFEVSYCGAHKDGIRFSFPPGVGNAKSNKQCLLAIRSFDYYQDFMQKNGKWKETAS